MLLLLVIAISTIRNALASTPSNGTRVVLMNIDEMKRMADPEKIEISDQLKETNEKLDKLIELQEAANNPEGDGILATLRGILQVLHCTKNNDKSHRGKSLYLLIGFTVITFTCDYFLQGESSITLSILKFCKGLMPW